MGRYHAYSRRVEVIIGLGVGAAVLYLWGWQRVKYVGWFLQRHKRAEAFERAMREAREDINGPCPYRLPSAEDRELLARLPDDRELVAAGFTPLGELVVQYADKPAGAAARAYVDAAGTTLAMWMVTRKSPVGIPRLASYAGDRIFSTGRLPYGALAEPPFVTRQMLDAKQSIADMAARHRTLAGDQPLDRIASLDELLARLATNHDRIVAWRAAQAPDELLDLDLKSALGDAYARHGKPWARRLRGKLPEATLRT